MGERSETQNTSKLTPEILFQQSPERLYPKMKLVNTRVFITEMRKKWGEDMTLANLPEEEWDTLLEGSFESVYLMGIYKTGTKARDIALQYKEQYIKAFPDMKDEDVVGSCFSIAQYVPAEHIVSCQNESEDVIWKEFDEKVHDRLNKKGVKVILDWVPYDEGIDSPLAITHPELFLQKDEQFVRALPLEEQRLQFEEVVDKNGVVHYIAHPGPDYDIPWIDKLALDPSNPQVLEHKLEQAKMLSNHCDGLRVDMAFLWKPEEIQAKWGKDNWMLSEDKILNIFAHFPYSQILPQLFAYRSEFEIMGEIYRDEDIHELVQVGFTAAYDEKTLKLYKQIVTREISAIDLIPHLRWLTEFLVGYRSIEYSENHDIERAIRSMGKKASIVLAAIQIATSRTIYMAEEGQEVGNQTPHQPMQLKRAPEKESDMELKALYQRLYRGRNSELFQMGEHNIAEALPVHPDNTSNKDIIVQRSELPSKIGMIQCSNTGNWESACKINIPEGVKEIRVYDILNDTWFEGDKITAVDQGGNLFIGLPSYGIQVVYYAY